MSLLEHIIDEIYELDSNELMIISMKIDKELDRRKSIPKEGIET